jgi:hypothetical protein
VVQVIAGPGSPANNTVGAGSSDVPVLQVKVTNTSGEAVQLSGIDLSAFGTGVNATGVLTLTLWKDGDGLGVVDGTTTTLATVNLPYVSGNNIVVNFSDTIAAGAFTDYLITYTFSNGALPGTYGADIPNGGLTGQGTVSNKNLNVTGGQVNGAVLTVIAQTATPTHTPTVTSSFTPTASVTRTSTMTPTKTATTLPRGTQTPIIYPNPSSGGDVEVECPGTGTGNVTVEIFTTAFRRVQSKPYPNVPLGTNTGNPKVAMTDDWGNPLASGLYYVVVTINQTQGAGGKVTRLVGKLLLIR